VWGQTKRGCHVLYQQGRAWALLEDVDEETLTKDVTHKRAAENRKAITQHHNEVRDLQRQAANAANQGHPGNADRFNQAFATRVTVGPVLPHADDDVTERDIVRHRRSQQAGRCAIIAAAAVGTFMFGPQHPILLLAALVGGLGAAWWAGRHREPSDDEESSQSAMAAESPATIAAAAAAGGPGPAVLTKTDDVQVRGADDLITAFVKAKVIDDNERDETRIVGLRSDGPGWTATIELPPGRPAAHAIDRLVPLASALRVKASRIEMKADTSAGGHEGQFTMWVADADNPFGGGKNRSMLIDAPRWEFWQDGAPLGADARHARQALHLMWSSLLIGGLQDYGKSYLARLIAAAGALDPYVRIVVITGKAGPDWAPLKKIAHAYTAGSTPDRLAQVHEILDELIVNMQGRGETLERLSEEDPATCPEGKLTPDLARKPGMELTLLIVDELQELLDAAANTRIKGEEDEDGKTGRGRNGKEVLVETLARYVRVTRFVGGMGVFITQRPDSDSVPTKLREVCVKRGSFRVKGPGSSKMVLGEEAVQAGAAPHKLLEHHKGVVVLDQGAETGHVTVKADVIELPEFRAIVDRAYDLRATAGTLSGQAASRSRVDEAAARAAELRRDAVAVFDRLGVPDTQGLRAESLAEELGVDVDALRERLRRDGITTTNIVTFGDRKRLKGFKQDQFTSPEAA
jgi:S-DNA-T family DNA segregation ATPase FtsK/SpoIIIE